ncbi:MAG: hypothetical protein WAS26_02640, partial [Paracoccaceae bacterium]
LVRALGNAAGNHLADLAWGRDARPVSLLERERSVGNEETFARDVDDPEVVLAEFLRLSGKVGRRLRRAGYLGTTVSIKVRFADFTTITRSRKLAGPTDSTRQIFAAASSLYDALHLERARLRLVGVRMEGIVEARDQQIQLELGAPTHGWRGPPLRS